MITTTTNEKADTKSASMDRLVSIMKHQTGAWRDAYLASTVAVLTIWAICIVNL